MPFQSPARLAVVCLFGAVYAAVNAWPATARAGGPGDCCQGTETAEGEPCGQDTNGGCDSRRPVFGSIAIGESICGTAWAKGGARDGDWYLFTATDPVQYEVTLESEFPAEVSFVIALDNCVAIPVETTTSDGCTPGTAITKLSNGDFAILVRPQATDGVPCGGGNGYRLTLDTVAAGACNPDAGDCCAANGTPGCEDEACCTAVCAADSFCCESKWDGICADMATDLCTALCVPANDACIDAVAIDVPSVTAGFTDNATAGDAGFCGTNVLSPGVWYLVGGTGNTMTATTCENAIPPGSADYDSKISVYCGDCDEPVCVDGNDNAPFCGNRSTVIWCSEAGATYLVLVHGFASTGNFQLSVFDDGVPCAGGVSCLPAGACCFGDGSCGDGFTDAGCDEAGGIFQGAGVTCAAGGAYEAVACTSLFEDISLTGIEAPNASTMDDDGDIVPIGFVFDFYGTPRESIAVCSNGYLTFGDDLSDFTPDPIPTAEDPNDLIAPWWDDWSPNQSGSVHYQTLGIEPSRRFIAQWTEVPPFNAAGSATFQAVLFEGSNAIEFRYGDTLAFVGPTVGIENPDGSDGVGLGTDFGPGDCGSVAPQSGIDCGRPSCPGDINGDGAVTRDDLIALIGAWGGCPDPPGLCPWDLDGNGQVDISDLIELIVGWGPCV